MKFSELSVLIVVVSFGTACNPTDGWWWYPPRDHGGGSTRVDAGSDAGSEGELLATLPLSQAPSPTEPFASWTLYWGTLDVAAPGFAAPPRDVLTLALDAANYPRYLEWRELPAFPKTFGDGGVSQRCGCPNGVARSSRVSTFVVRCARLGLRRALRRTRAVFRRLST